MTACMHTWNSKKRALAHDIGERLLVTPTETCALARIWLV